MLNFTSRSGTIRPEDVGVTAMSADAGRRQVDCALPTDSNMVSVVVERFRQDSWSRVGSGVPGQSGDVDGGSDLAEGPATVLLTGSDEGADFAGRVAVMNTPPAVFADGVPIAVTSLLEWLLLMWLLWPMLGWSP